MRYRRFATVSNLRDFECGKVLELLDSYLAGELTVETNHAVIGHLQRCLGCRTESEAHEGLRLAVHRVVARGPEPSPGFEKRLRALLEATPASVPRRSPFPLFAFAAVLVAIAASAGLLLSTRPGTPPDGAPGAAGSALARLARSVDVQLNCTLKRKWPAAPPKLNDVVREAGPSWASAIRELAPQLAGYRLVSAHECPSAGQRLFHIVLRSEADRSPDGYISVVVAPRISADASLDPLLAEMKLRATQAGPALRIGGGRVQGFDVVATSSREHLVFIVSRRGRAENVALAGVVLPGILSAVRAHEG